jgi:hypothetical protein
MDIKIIDYQDFSVWLVSKPNLPQFSHFVANVYRKRYPEITGASCNSMITEMAEEDIKYCKQAFFYAIKSKDGKVAGTIRVCKWQDGMVFPMERIWCVSVPDLMRKLPFVPPQVWHLGRFAVDRDVVVSDPRLRKAYTSLFKTLLIMAFRHICSHENNLMIAECDTRLNDKIKLMGIHLTVAEHQVNYLGSNVVPVYNTGKDLQSFINKYSYE